MCVSPALWCPCETPQHSTHRNITCESRHDHLTVMCPTRVTKTASPDGTHTSLHGVSITEIHHTPYIVPSIDGTHLPLAPCRAGVVRTIIIACHAMDAGSNPALGVPFPCIIPGQPTTCGRTGFFHGGLPHHVPKITVTHCNHVVNTGHAELTAPQRPRLNMCVERGTLLSHRS